jgi:hypothetical protein
MDRQLGLDSRDVPTVRELSQTELDGVSGGQGVLFGLMQKVRDQACAGPPGDRGPVAVPYPNNT